MLSAKTFKTPKEPIFELPKPEIPQIAVPHTCPTLPTAKHIQALKQALATKLAFHAEHRGLDVEDRLLLERCIQQDRVALNQEITEAKKQIENLHHRLIEKQKLADVLKNQSETPEVKELLLEIRKLGFVYDELQELVLH
jgi:hypothetical protein